MYAKVFFIFRSFLSTPVRAYRPVFCLHGLRNSAKRGGEAKTRGSFRLFAQITAE